jgi:hypothetical protein
MIYRPFLDSNSSAGRLVMIPASLDRMLMELRFGYKPADDPAGQQEQAPELFDPLIMRAILTNYTIQSRVNVNVTPTLQKQTFVYVCGDTPEQFRLSGTTFNVVCQSGADDAGQSKEAGVSLVMQAYRKYKLSSNYAPSVVTFTPGISNYGHLIDFTVGGYNEALDTFTFDMGFLAIPSAPAQRKEKRDEGGT